jgi:hypothetical protein
LALEEWIAQCRPPVSTPTTKPSAEQRKELQKLAARPDREIDLSDIPETRESPGFVVTWFCL